MPYVDRDPKGHVVAGYDTPQWDEQEWLPADAAEWREFIEQRYDERIRRLRDELAETDRFLSRAMEDLIRIMMVKNALSEADLPEPLIQRMAYKERLRARLQAELNALDLAGGRES